MDVLSDVLRVVRQPEPSFSTSSADSLGRTHTSGRDFARAVMPGSDHVIAFHVLTRGSCWAEVVDGSVPSVSLHTGDLIVLPIGR